MSGTTTGTQAVDTALEPGQSVSATGQEQTADDDKAAQTDPSEPDAGKAKEEDEANKRIARAEFEKREARRQARDLQARLDAIQRSNPPPAGSPEERQADIDRSAAEQIKVRDFNARCDTIYADGTKEYPDFAQAILAFQAIGGLSTELIEAADEAGNPHKILRYLGQNLDEAEALRSLSPARLGAAVARLAAKAGAAPPPPPVSKAPPPVPTVTGVSRGEPDPEKMTPEQYHAWRLKRRKSG